MSGPRRHGSRLSAAACLFVLLVLAVLLVRGGVASADSGKSAHGRHHHSAGLLGGVGKIVTKVGHQVDHVLTGVGGVLGNRPHTHPTTPASTPPTATPTPTPTPTPKPSSSAPTPRPTQTPTKQRTSTSTTSRPARSPARHGVGSIPRHVSPVATSSTLRPTASPTRTHDVARAVDPGPNDIPGLDITAALAAVMIATVLGVGLVVYRAGYRGGRTH